MKRRFSRTVVDESRGELGSRRSRRWRTRVGLALLSTFGLGCAPQVRFPNDVQTAVAPRNHMRRMETDQLIIYYPEGSKDATLRIASRLEYCRTELMKRAHVKGGPAAGAKSVFVMPNVPYNNAYISPAFAGQEQVAVLPQFSTMDYFVTLGLPPDPGIIGCHEMVHDVVNRQLSGIQDGIRYAFGELMTPGLGFEGWFQEGIAVFYETRLLGLGRLDNKYFSGNLAAGMAGRRIDGSMAVTGHRLPNFGHYLIGAHFIDYLMQLKGEDALWEVIERQSNELTWPIAVTGRFQKVYGKPLRGLFKDFSKELQDRYPVRYRPDNQHEMTKLGREAVFGVSQSGRYAAITYDVDRAPVLEVYESNGTKAHSRHLIDLLVGRRILTPPVEFASGISLTADGEQVFFVLLDRGPIFWESRLVHVDVDQGKLNVLNKDIGGAGGSVSPDGKFYYFVRPLADSYAVFEYKVSTGAVRQVTKPGARHFHTGPIASPDGNRLLVTESSWAGLGLAIYDVATGKRLQEVAAPRGPKISGSWSGDQRVVYSADDGERLQVFETDLGTSKIRKLTDAPYLTWEPYVAHDHLLFLNREDWHFTVDETLYPSDEAVPFGDDWVAKKEAKVEPESTESKNAEPEAAKPEATKPETAKPEAAKPEAPPAPAKAAPAAPPAKKADEPKKTEPQAPTQEEPQPKTGYRITEFEEQYAAFIMTSSLAQAAAPPEAPAPAPAAAEEPAAEPEPTQAPAEKPAGEANPDGTAEGAAASTGEKEEPDASEASGEGADPEEESGPWTAYARKDHQEPELAQVNVHSDRRYSGFPGFFRPRSWGPSFESREQSSYLLKLGVGGGDDLGYNRWLIEAGYDWVAQLPNAKFQIVNAMAAPYYFDLQVQHIGRSEKTLNDFEDAPDERIQVRETIASFDVERMWYGSTSVALGMRYYDALYTVQESGTDFEAFRLAGPGLAFSHVTQESTAYTGPRLGFALAGAVNYYPADLSVDDFDLTDVGGGVGAVFPLPLSRRHTLKLSASSRALLGAPDSARMLQVGGAPTDGPALSNEPRPDGQRLPGQVPPSISFRSDLRGFEDLALFGSQVVSGEAEYTYPFIIDTGSLSTLYLLPSFLFRQIDLDLFFTSASLLEGADDEVAMAVGAALDFKMQLWNFPITITLQESRRLSHDEEWAFYFGFGLE